MRTILYFSLLTALPSNAFAHLGHVAEVAGHGHWVAVGAGIIAAGLAALLGKKSADEITAEEDVEGAVDGDLEGAST